MPKNEKNKNFAENNDIEKEFENLENNIDNDSTHQDNLIQEFDNKDRYPDIKPYKYNNIQINIGTKDNHYINASPLNIMNNKYCILTQGPKENTIEDFWTMIDEQKCYIIVMLCNLQEGGREKCAKYWHKTMKKYNINKISEKNKIEEKNNKFYKIRKLLLINNQTKEERKIVQIHYKGWPDHGTPDIEDKDVFPAFIEMNKIADEEKKDGPIVVHCSAGVGRTGTFVTMYLLEKEIRNQLDNPKLKNIKFNIFNLVRKLKEMRLYLVQNVSQYFFIYTFADYLLKHLNK
jgi:protein tyrosine phosphatase